MWKCDLPKKGPVYLGIVAVLQRDIERGRLTAGERLPAHRELARQLAVTVGTVSKAFGEAERRGLIVSRVGRGSYVLAFPEHVAVGRRRADRPCRSEREHAQRSSRSICRSIAFSAHCRAASRCTRCSSIIRCPAWSGTARPARNGSACAASHRSGEDVDPVQRLPGSPDGGARHHQPAGRLDPHGKLELHRNPAARQSVPA